MLSIHIHTIYTHSFELSEGKSRPILCLFPTPLARGNLTLYNSLVRHFSISTMLSQSYSSRALRSIFLCSFVKNSTLISSALAQRFIVFHCNRGKWTHTTFVTLSSLSTPRAFPIIFFFYLFLAFCLYSIERY